jgi:opacity protein-like surface antigen
MLESRRQSRGKQKSASIWIHFYLTGDLAWIGIVPMKRIAAYFFCVLLAASAVRAQTVYSASVSPLTVTVGGMGSIFQPDYIGGTSAQSNGLGIQYGLVGMGIYVDVRFRRWVQVEAEGRWMNFNVNPILLSAPQNNVTQTTDVQESTYFIGPRVPLHHYGRFTPYAKALIGVGRTTTNKDILGSNGGFGGLAWTYGGGVDYKLTRRISIRPFDLEYQSWKLAVNVVNSSGVVVQSYNFTPHPYGASAGISYRFF